MALSTMLRIHFMQQWYALSDPAMEDALYEIESMRRFAGIELNEGAIPDKTTILTFRRRLERHDLAPTLLRTVNAHLADKGLARSWTPRSSLPRVRPRIVTRPETRTCVRRRKASSGTSA